jgi:hypothetical protein
MGIGFAEGNVDDRCEVRGEADTVTSRDGLKFSTQGRSIRSFSSTLFGFPAAIPAR